MRSEEGLTGALLEIQYLTHGRAVGFDPVDEEDMQAYTHGMIVVLALLSAVYRVPTAPEEMTGGEVLDDRTIRVKLQIQTLAHQGGICRLDALVMRLLCPMLLRA